MKITKNLFRSFKNTPSSYINQNNKVLKVNASGTGLEFGPVIGNEENNIPIANGNLNINLNVEKLNGASLSETFSNSDDYICLSNAIYGFIKGLVAGSGYLNLSDGLQFRWDNITNSTDDNQVVYYPLAFSNACLQIVTASYSGTYGGTLAFALATMYYNYFIINRDNDIDGTHYMRYFAVGY